MNQPFQIFPITEANAIKIAAAPDEPHHHFHLGYNEKAYFTAVFKKKSGQTPTEFREEMRRLTF